MAARRGTENARCRQGDVGFLVRRQRRRRVLDPGHGGEEPVTACGYRLNAASFRSALIENPAERRDLDGQLAFSTTERRQTAAMISSFVTSWPASLDEHAQNIERAGADGQRNEDTALIAPRQALTAPIEAKFVEQEYFGRAEHVPRLPVLRAGTGPLYAEPLPTRSSRPILNQLRSLERNFATFLEIF